MTTMWVLILVNVYGAAAPLRVGAYYEETKCEVQAKVMVENIHQAGPAQFAFPWRAVCVPVQSVTP